MEEGGHWVVWEKELTEDEVRRRYFEMTGREPDRIHSPEESKTPFWWTGWVCPRCGRVNAPHIDQCPCRLTGGS